MSKNSTSANSTVASVTAATASSSAKKVTKKSDAPAAAAAPAQAAAAATVTSAKKVAAKATGSASTAAATASTASAASPAPAPVAEAPVASVAQVAEEQPAVSIDQEIAELVKVHQALRDQAVSAIKNLQKLQKRVAKEIKEAGRRRRVKKAAVDENGAPKEKRPTIFTTPVTLKDELCLFLGKAKGSKMTPADVTKAFSAYVESHKLKDAEKGHTIHPDAAMRKVLSLAEGEEISYKTVQKHLYKLYVLPEKKAVASK